MKSVMEMTDEEVSLFRVEHGIEIWPYERATNSKYGKLLHKLKPGDSVFFPEKEMARSAYRWFHSKGIKAQYRPEINTEKYGEGFRVWRMK